MTSNDQVINRVTNRQIDVITGCQENFKNQPKGVSQKRAVLLTKQMFLSSANE